MLFQLVGELPSNPKIRALMDRCIDEDPWGAMAVSLWTLSGSLSREALTDGVVSRTDTVRIMLNPAWADGCARLLVETGLWHDASTERECATCAKHLRECATCGPLRAGEYRFHDWWQRGYEHAVQSKVVIAKKKELQDPQLRAAVWDRDADPRDQSVAQCRYCGVVCKHADRKSRTAWTLDHVDPTRSDGAANLVVACKRCNQQKGNRTPEQAGMTLRPGPRQQESHSQSRRQASPVQVAGPPESLAGQASPVQVAGPPMHVSEQESAEASPVMVAGAPPSSRGGQASPTSVAGPPSSAAHSSISTEQPVATGSTVEEPAAAAPARRSREEVPPPPGPGEAQWEPPQRDAPPSAIPDESSRKSIPDQVDPGVDQSGGRCPRARAGLVGVQVRVTGTGTGTGGGAGSGSGGGAGRRRRRRSRKRAGSESGSGSGGSRSSGAGSSGAGGAAGDVRPVDYGRVPGLYGSPYRNHAGPFRPRTDESTCERHGRDLPCQDCPKETSL